MAENDLGVPAASAQDEAYGWLKRHIGTLPRSEGTFLTEVEVTRVTGRSRTPVREAMLRLEAEGLLQSVPKKGAFVPPITDTEVVSVMQARELVETWAIRQVTSHAGAIVPQLELLIDQQQSLQNEPVQFISCDREFHRTAVRAAGNSVLSDFYESIRDRQMRMGLRAIANSPERVGTVLAEHRAIVDAVRSEDAEKAAEAVAQHLSSTLLVLQLPAVGR